MSGTITQWRTGLRDALIAEFPDMPVYASPPNNPAAPCIILRIAGGRQRTANIWTQTLRAVIVGPGGDNEATTQTFEDMLLRAAAVLSEETAQPVNWEEPGQTTLAGAPYLATTLDVSFEVTPGG